jgi:hypothetical protein
VRELAGGALKKVDRWQPADLWQSARKYHWLLIDELQIP